MKAEARIDISLGKESSTATMDGVKVEVSPRGDVTVYASEGVRTKPADSAANGVRFGISDNLNTHVLKRRKSR